MFRSPKPWWKMTDEERANLHRKPAPPKPISRVELATRILVGSGLDLALAAAFLITWLRPYTFGEFAVKHFTLLMLLEFLVVHATGFMGALTSRSMGLFERILIFSLLFLFYIGMAFGMSVGMGSYWPALGFGLMLLGKLPTILRPQHEDDAMMGIMANWAAMVCLYLFGIFFVVTADIPHLGITPEVIASQKFDVGGEFPERPYIVMAFGTLYFTGLALLNLITQGLTYRASQKALGR
jgi:hypothetical protein